MIPFWAFHQGFDLKDGGYEINMGKFFVSNPETTNYPMFLCALVSWLLGCFLELFHIPVLVGYKAAKIVLVLASDLLIYSIYKKYMRQYTVLLLLLVCNVMVLVSTPMLSYNSLGNFFSVLMLYFLHKGETEKKNRSYALAGLVFAVNIFVRFPNIVQGIVVTAIILTVCWEQEKKSVWEKIGCFLSGGAAGLLLMLGVVQLCVGVPAYLQAVKGLFVYAQSEETIYGFSQMLRNLLGEGINGVIKFVKLAIPVLIGGIGIRYTTKVVVWGGVKRYYIIEGITAVVLTVLIFGNQAYRQPIGWVELLVAATGVFGIAVFCCGKFPCGMRFLAVVSVFLLISMPVGSSTRFYFFLNNGFQIFMPILFYVLFERRREIYDKAVGGIVIGCMLLTMGGTALGYRYGETEQERRLVRNDPGNYLNGTVTGVKRQENILELEYFFEAYEGGRESMITLGDAPMLHAILDIPPFFPEVNGWTDLSQLDITKIKRTFEKGSCPLIIVDEKEFYAEQPRMKELRHTFFDELIETEYTEIYRNGQYAVYQYKE